MSSGGSSRAPPASSESCRERTHWRRSDSACCPAWCPCSEAALPGSTSSTRHRVSSRRAGAYGLAVDAQSAATFGLGEGLVGQCARDGRPVTLTNLPPDYLRIVSGVGAAAPVQVLASPLLSKDTLLGVVETATFHPLDSRESALLGELTAAGGDEPRSAAAQSAYAGAARSDTGAGPPARRADRPAAHQRAAHAAHSGFHGRGDVRDVAGRGHHLRQRRGVPDAGLHDGGHDRTTGARADPPPSCGWERVSGGGMSDAHRVSRG